MTKSDLEGFLENVTEAVSKVHALAAQQLAQNGIQSGKLMIGVMWNGEPLSVIVAFAGQAGDTQEELNQKNEEAVASFVAKFGKSLYSTEGTTVTIVQHSVSDSPEEIVNPSSDRVSMRTLRGN